MAEKILNTRIQLRYDTLENWTSSTLALKKGELAIVTLGTVKDGSTAGDVNQHPVLFKVGDGSHTFAQLPFASALAADVYAWAKASDVQLTNKELVFVGTNKKIAIPYITEDEAKGFINDALAAYSTTEQMNAAIKVEADRAKAAEEALGERIDAFNLPEGGFASKTEFDALKGKVEDEDGALAKANEAYALAETKANATETTTALAGKADKSVVEAMYTNAKIDELLATKQDTIPAETYDAYGAAATAEGNAKAYTDAEIAKIPAQVDYTVTMTETTTGLASDIAKKYTFTQNGAEIGSINLAKELVVTSGSVKEVTVADMPYVGAVVGDKYIELVIANQDAPIYVPAKDLVDIYTAGAGAAEVQVAISNTNEITATLVNGGIAEEKLAEGVKTKLNKTWEEVGVAEGLVNAAKSELEGKINAKADAALLGDLAAKDTVAEADLDTALAEKINTAATTAENAMSSVQSQGAELANVTATLGTITDWTGAFGENTVTDAIEAADQKVQEIEGTLATYGDLATKSEVTEAELGTELAEKINAKADAASLGTMSSKNADDYYTETEVDAKFGDLSFEGGTIKYNGMGYIENKSQNGDPVVNISVPFTVGGKEVVIKEELAGYYTKNEADNAFQAKGEYATAAQGAKADSAIQEVTANMPREDVYSGLAVSQNGTSVNISIDDSLTFVFDCGDANGASLNA